MNMTAGSAPSPNPRLSVVVATVDPWPTAQACLESLEDQAQAEPIEILVMDGSGNGLPPGHANARVCWYPVPGNSVFQLRALGLAAARGEIVASTEDHCRVAPDWCRILLQLHEQYPNAGGIGGAVENGADRSTLDWVHFLIANGPYMRPNRSLPDGTITGQANVSFKRRFLPSEAPHGGVLQMDMNRRLRDRGVELRMDDRLVVWHIQSLGLLGTCRMHFHTGRCIAGFRLPHLSAAGRILRMASCAILPAFLAGRTIATVLRKKRCRIRLFLGLPFLALLVSCHSIGELIGYCFGAGESPWKTR